MTNKKKRESKPPKCPKCGGSKVVRVVYGRPSSELTEMAERREVVLGGCCVNGDEREWVCRECNHDFGRLLFDDHPEDKKTIHNAFPDRRYKP